jgi:hypothetical protein
MSLIRKRPKYTFALMNVTVLVCCAWFYYSGQVQEHIALIAAGSLALANGFLLIAWYLTRNEKL